MQTLFTSSIVRRRGGCESLGFGGRLGGRLHHTNSTRVYRAQSPFARCSCLRALVRQRFSFTAALVNMSMYCRCRSCVLTPPTETSAFLLRVHVDKTVSEIRVAEIGFVSNHPGPVHVFDPLEGCILDDGSKPEAFEHLEALGLCVGMSSVRKCHESLFTLTQRMDKRMKRK